MMKTLVDSKTGRVVARMKGKEVFDYEIENGDFIEIGGIWHLIVEAKNLDEVAEYAGQHWRSTIYYGNWDEEGDWYRIENINSITKTCEGTYLVDFILSIVE